MARVDRRIGHDSNHALAGASQDRYCRQDGKSGIRADAMEAAASGWRAWWIDSIGSLAIVWFLVKEGREAWSGDECWMIAIILLCTSGQAEEKEPTAIIELGAASEWGLSGASSFGPTVAVEFTPIKDWLEIEPGASPLFGGGRTEWDTDLILKKPFTLSDEVEIMLVRPRLVVLAGGIQGRR